MKKSESWGVMVTLMMRNELNLGSLAEEGVERVGTVVEEVLMLLLTLLLLFRANIEANEFMAVNLKYLRAMSCSDRIELFPLQRTTSLSIFP